MAILTWTWFLAAAADPVELFNRKDLSGWAPTNGGVFRVENGVLILSGGNGWLRTEKDYGDFEIEIEWRAAPEYAGGKPYDSGLFFRTAADGKPWPAKKYQFNMKHGAGGDLSGMPGIAQPGRPELLKPAGEWNAYRLRCEGRKATAWINGTQIWTTDKIAAPKGRLGLQAEGYRLEFRRIALKTLDK